VEPGALVSPVRPTPGSRAARARRASVARQVFEDAWGSCGAAFPVSRASWRGSSWTPRRLRAERGGDAAGGALLALILESPGIAVSELARLLLGGWGSLDHHLAVLEGEGHVIPVRGAARGAPPGREGRGVPRKGPRPPQPLRRARRAIALHVAAHPGPGVATLVADLGLPLRVAYNPPERLVEDVDGSARRTPRGRSGRENRGGKS